MLKFTIDSKELKTMIDKSVAILNKKALISSLTKLYFKIETDGILKILGTDLTDFEHYVEIRSANAWNIIPGEFGIDIDDLKVIIKMNGNITIEDISIKSDYKIKVICGNKTVTIPKYEDKNVTLPFLNDTEECILTVKEAWLLDTVTNLFFYTSNKEHKTYPVHQSFNFNTKNKRVEALNDYMIGIRTLDEKDINKENDNLILHNICVPIFKKILNKKSLENIKLLQDNRYIKAQGNDFTYITKRIKGTYLDVEKFLTKDYKYSFNVNRKNILSIMKYNYDLLKGFDKIPVILYNKNNKLYAYFKTKKYKVVDIIETENMHMNANLHIGFNPYYLANIFNIIDVDNPICKGIDNKSPLFIYGKKYMFFIMSMYLKTEVIEEMKQSIN